MRARATWLVLAMLLACGPAGLPEIRVSGDGADGIRLSDWRDVRVHGQVVRWEARLTRVTDLPLGEIRYSLFDDQGRKIVSDRPRFRGELKPGDTVQATFLASGPRLGSNVRRIEVVVTRPGREGGDRALRMPLLQ